MASPNNYEPLRQTHREVDANMSGSQRPEQTQQQQAPQSQQERQPRPELQGLTPLEAAEARDKERLQLAREMSASGRYRPGEVRWHVRDLDQRELQDQVKKDDLAAQKARVQEVQQSSTDKTDDQTKRAEDRANAIEARQQQQSLTQSQEQSRDR